MARVRLLAVLFSLGILLLACANASSTKTGLVPPRHHLMVPGPNQTFKPGGMNLVTLFKEHLDPRQKWARLERVMLSNLTHCLLTGWPLFSPLTCLSAMIAEAKNVMMKSAKSFLTPLAEVALEDRLLRPMRNSIADLLGRYSKETPLSAAIRNGDDALAWDILHGRSDK